MKSIIQNQRILKKGERRNYLNIVNYSDNSTNNFGSGKYKGSNGR